MSPLPIGFDPDGGTFANIKLGPPRTNNTYAPAITFEEDAVEQTRPRRLSLWQRFDRAVSNLGNWFSDNYEETVDRLSLALFWLLLIGSVVAVVGVWVSKGLWPAVFTGVGAFIVLGIGYYVGEIVLSIVLGIVMYVLRFLFWNAWTLLIVLGLVGGGMLYSRFGSMSLKDAVEMVVPSTTSYTCTAKVLNVRSAPNTGSSVLGVLTKGQTVDVLETTDGFARIDFNGHTGYVSLKYLAPAK